MKKFQLFLIIVFLFLPSASLLAADSRKGEKIYQRHCSFCHGSEGNPAMPSAANFSRGEGLMRSDQALKDRIEKGRGTCPSFRGVIRDREILDLIAHLRTLY